MRPARLALALASIFALAACQSGGSAAWTYAPAPSATPGPSASAAASGGASAPASAAPSGSVAPGSAAPSGAVSGATVTVVATSPAKFDTPDLTAPANKPFTLVFNNQDASSPHNVVIVNPDGSKVSMGDTAFFTGPAKRMYQVPALAPGAYPFHCEVHPNTMKGTLTVK
ncbi:MAG: cupredoxin domain-containing protein [Chloroflexota bacterium]|nr:cupredoxin domain-containing protein [Chloroflexota bacterium]